MASVLTTALYVSCINDKQCKDEIRVCGYIKSCKDEKRVCGYDETKPEIWVGLCRLGSLKLINFLYFSSLFVHTTYTRNIMCLKCGGDCGLLVLNEMIKKIYPENLRNIVGALWELPAK